METVIIVRARPKYPDSVLRQSRAVLACTKREGAIDRRELQELAVYEVSVQPKEGRLSLLQTDRRKQEWLRTVVEAESPVPVRPQ